MIVPGSGLVRAQAEEEGLADIFKDAGFEWRLAGCSMCLAMNPDQLAPGERCAATSNRNFEGRQGRGGRTHLMTSCNGGGGGNHRSFDRRAGDDVMEKFDKLSGVAAPMPLVNIDTDMIIPKQFLKTIKRSGLGVNLFDEMRYNDDGSEKPDFVLNKPAYRNAQIIVAGENFGCGSSREHAPWALLDFGIRCVISTSFADIFYNNCFKNGILPIVLPAEQVAVLMEDAEKGQNARISIDLESQQITAADGEVFHFEIDAFKKHCLMNGLDDIGLTLGKVKSIDAFEAKAATARPWV